MMKLYKKNLFVLVLLLSILILSANTTFAITDKKEEDARKNAKVEYTNEMHSVFSLKDCVDIAVEYNPSIKASIYNELAYKSKIGQAWANFFPEISAGLNVSRMSDKYSGNSPYADLTYTMGYIPTVSAEMMLFDFGKTKATADYAKRVYEAKTADTKENINSIIYNIKSAYFNILFAQAQIKVYEDTVKDYELQLSQANAFYKIGKKAKIDVVTAEYNLGKAKLNLVKAKNVLQVARVQLSQIMGIPEYTNYELSDELTLNDFDELFEDLLNTAYDVRPELISYKKLADAAKMNLRAKKRNYTPDIGIYGSYKNGKGTEYDIASGQVGVGLAYNSLNIMRVKKQVDQAKAEYKKALADYDNKKNIIYLNVKKNYLDLQTAKESIIIAKLALDEAKEQYRQVTGRYKAGVSDAIELKDGENTYLNARLDFYNAMLNYNTTAASLEREVGVPLKFSDRTIFDKE